MKKILLAVLTVTAIILTSIHYLRAGEITPAIQEKTSVEAQKSTNSILRKGHIVFYTQETCHYCREAMAYIKKELPDLRMEIIDISTDEGMAKFRNLSRKYRLKSLGTPFITLGENDYIMGWGKQSETRLKNYVEEMNK